MLMGIMIPKYGVCAHIDPSRGWGCAWHNFGEFNRQLLAPDTLKILTTTTPLYIASRAGDHPLHHKFYSRKHHKNKRQLPQCCYHTVDIGLGVVMISLASLSLWSPDEHLQSVAQLYAVTLPYTWAIKKIIKRIKAEPCIRPKNQHFSRQQIYYGGCPSGHMMEGVYTAVYFGTQMGPWFGVPLGLFTAIMTIDFVTCNRHFISQMVAGAGLGMIFAYAANNALKCCNTPVCVSLVSQADSLALRAEYKF